MRACCSTHGENARAPSLARTHTSRFSSSSCRLRGIFVATRVLPRPTASHRAIAAIAAPRSSAAVATAAAAAVADRPSTRPLCRAQSKPPDAVAPGPPSAQPRLVHPFDDEDVTVSSLAERGDLAHFHAKLRCALEAAGLPGWYANHVGISVKRRGLAGEGQADAYFCVRSQYAGENEWREQTLRSVKTVVAHFARGRA